MINKVTLVGRLGADPDIRYTPSGAPVANLNIATTRRWKDKQSSERKEDTEWHRVILFARLAEVVKEYLTKGDLIYIEGRMQTRKWQDQSGQTRYTAEIVAEQMQMLNTTQNNQPTHTATSEETPPPEDYDDVPF